MIMTDEWFYLLNLMAAQDSGMFSLFVTASCKVIEER